MESSCSRAERQSCGSKVSSVSKQPALVDWAHRVEVDKSSGRPQRSGRHHVKSRSGPVAGKLRQEFHASVAVVSSTWKTSSRPVTSSLSTARRAHAPAAAFRFHSPEVATNSTTSLPAETSPMTNPWVVNGDGSKTCGLVRRKSDLGPITESEKVSTTKNPDGVDSREQVSRSVRRSRIQPPSAVHQRAEPTSSHLSTVSEPECDDNLRTASSPDRLVTAGGPQVASQTESSTATRPHVLALSDHISCLRQKNQRRRGDVISSGDHVMSNGASEPVADSKHVNGEW